ncbi:unnamed protein product [Cylindrotheca closterium]|uniref:Uncharacterized protein n=1 Tax=Cylindrotheca closterium TaxID=2856 RepID=A0AAD2JHY7_9STRA|nr:unnamed protein product [Cylindrotheca closterium]
MCSDDLYALTTSSSIITILFFWNCNGVGRFGSFVHFRCESDKPLSFVDLSTRLFIDFVFFIDELAIGKFVAPTGPYLLLTIGKPNTSMSNPFEVP